MLLYASSGSLTHASYAPSAMTGHAIHYNTQTPDNFTHQQKYKRTIPRLEMSLYDIVI